MGRKCTIKLYYQQLPLQCFKNCIEVSDCHTHTGLFKPELPLHTGIRIKIAMKLKTHSQKEIAPGEARTHGLQIMRLTRCLLRYGGLVKEGNKVSSKTIFSITIILIPYPNLCLRKEREKNLISNFGHLLH